MTIPATETLSTIPEIPKDFGEDGGHFYRCYDKLTEEADHDLIKSLTSQLDGILIFVRCLLLVRISSLLMALNGSYPLRPVSSPQSIQHSWH